MPAPKAAAPFAPVLPLPLTCVPPAALLPPRATLSEKVQFTMMAGLLPGDGLLKTAAPEAAPPAAPLPARPPRPLAPFAPPEPPLPPLTEFAENVQFDSTRSVPAW